MAYSFDDFSFDVFRPALRRSQAAIMGQGLKPTQETEPLYKVRQGVVDSGEA